MSSNFASKRKGSEDERSEIAKKGFVSLRSETECFVCETRKYEAKNTENKPNFFSKAELQRKPHNKCVITYGITILSCVFFT